MVGVGRPPRRPEETGDRCDQEVPENRVRHECARRARAGERGDGRDRRRHARGAAGPRGRCRAAGDAAADGGRRDRGVRAARAGTTRTGPRPGTAPRPARSPWVAAGCRSPGPGSAPPTAPARCRCRPTSCSPPPSCSGRMAMERMLAGVSTRRYPVALEPVGAGSRGRRRSRPASRRCRASSWR